MGSLDLDLHRPAILVVDDEPANRRLVRAYLGSTYEVHEAADGTSALAILQEHPIDLVLLDVMLPEMNGFDICRLIKQRTVTGYVPVILLTALGEQIDRNTGLAAGADDFLSKPVDRQELRLRVGNFVRLRKQDQRIRHQISELTQRDRVIQHQLEELEQLGTFKDELVSLLVHDLRNPLSGITGFLQILQENLQDPELLEDARSAIQAGGLLRETLDDILRVRMLEAGIVRLNREIIEAHSLVRDAIVSVEGAALARHVRIAAAVDEIETHFAVDRKLVRRAVENLLSNALKYSPSGGVVQTTVRRVGSELGIEVADRGAGVPENVRARLFEKFGSVEEAQGGERRGVGLGLYLVKLVATAHGGRAEAREREGGGTTFGLYLPADSAIHTPTPDPG